ncbi:hypothetical protein M0R89_11550 [Halorussus limi]|uniref:Uncharacterized protein n=1 Tax=Halorussus limi TaxID=2938695 RepID=A0A8U0HQ49_9EURY|nr:hypothetical protein [Halorussus limi]UPV73182.1 hypothetical protein M0R89_11550 [Halorussus limi]
MSDDNGYKAGQIRELIDGGNIDAVLDAYQTDIDDAADLLMMFDRAGVAEDNPLRAALARKARTETLRDARREGNLDTLSASSGLTDNRVDAGDRDLSDEVNRLFRPSDRDHMLNLVLYAPPPPEGPTGVGKTDFAYRILEEAIIEHLPYGGLEVSSNNRSDPFPDVESWMELEEWLEETDGTKAFVWDEAAQVLQYADMSAGKALSQLIKLLRKYNCHLILIAHTGKDIPKDVRRMVLFCQKESKKEATIGAGLEEDSSSWMVIRDEMMQFRDIDATSIEYDSEGDTGDFEFDKDENGDDADESNELELRKCRGHNRHGEGCGQRTRHESGYCDAHRDQWGGDPDPRLGDE